MADDFTNLKLQPGDLKPGDLITSELMNWLLKRITDLEASVGGVVGGPITVPNLFGRKLGDAQALLGQPGVQLLLGTILDTVGLTVLTTTQNLATRIVLGQSPPPGARVPANSGVALVVAANPGAGGSPGNIPPSITGFNQTTQNAGEFIRVLGANFTSLNTANTVKFATITADPPTTESDTLSLVVRIPTTIPGLPAVGSNATIPVSVTVTTVAGTSNAMTLTVGAPLPTPPPNITATDPAPDDGQRVGQVITITGTGFVAANQTTQVKFDNVKQTIPIGNNLSATKIVVTVPPGISGLGGTGNTRTVPITVLVGDRSSNEIKYLVSS